MARFCASLIIGWCRFRFAFFRFRFRLLFPAGAELSGLLFSAAGAFLGAFAAGFLAALGLFLGFSGLASFGDGIIEIGKFFKGSHSHVGIGSKRPGNGSCAGHP
jgi:hypothetical protein